MPTPSTFGPFRERVVERRNGLLGNRHDPADQPQELHGDAAALASDARQSVIMASDVARRPPQASG